MFAENGGELIDFYKTNFLLQKKHSFNISEIEDMVPFEREIYIMLLLELLEKEKNNTK
jgi:hypothetical protein